MMFLTNIGLLNNTATTHKELVNCIENAGFEVSELIYGVGQYDQNYEPTAIALLVDPSGVIADEPNVCAAMDSIAEELTQECIPVCFASLKGYMCGTNPKGYEFDSKFMLTINERNKYQPYAFPEYVSEPKVYASFDALLNTMDFWKNYFSKEELKPIV